MKILFPYMARWKAINWTRYHSILTELAEMGHEIYVLQPPPARSDETNFQEIDVVIPNNIRLSDIKIPPVFWKRNSPFDKLYKKGIYSLWCYSYARNIIEEKGIDVMLLYNIPQYLLVRSRSCKVVFDLADDYIDMLAKELGVFSNPLALGVASRLLNRMLGAADYVLAVSSVLAKDFWKGAIVIPNGVSPSKANKARLDPLNINIERPIVGFIGSFEYFIDFELILQTAANLSEVNFLLVGYGRSWAEVKNRALALGLKNVFFTGGVKHADVFRYINEMDLCLNVFKKMPVSHAACPMKVFEYMIMGKPVISTRLQEIENMNMKSITFADNLTEMISAIQYLINNPSERRKLGQLGQSIVLEKYTWRKIAEQFVDAVSS